MKTQNREEFKNAVFERDNHKCVIPWCNEPPVDAHHLIERRLWPKETGGYFLDNGVSVCETHHRLAEKNIITPMTLREYSGINRTILPDSIDPNLDVNKWGTPIKIPNRYYIKYPTTAYLPNSETMGNPMLFALGTPHGTPYLADSEVVITIKMDGSNACLRHDKVVARNGSSADHKSFDMIKSMHSTFQHLIPKNLQIFGEWLYAKQSIHYKNLSSYFQIFGVYDCNTRHFLDWPSTEKIAALLELETTPILQQNVNFKSNYEFLNTIEHLAKKVIEEGHEGIVVRSKYPIHYGLYESLIGKYVRANHIQTEKHWTNQQITKNELLKNSIKK